MLSERKASFLEKNSFFSYQLRAGDLPRIRDYYERQDLNIVINGETPHGQSLLAAKRLKLETLQKYLRAPTLKYAAYVMQNWRLRSPLREVSKAINFSMQRTVPSNDLENLRKVFSPFLTKDDRFRNLTRKELFELNAICKNVLKAEWLEAKIKLFNAFLTETQADICLEINECVEEMKILQLAMTADDVFGYIHTNNHSRVGGHFEIFIITPTSIIKPHVWPLENDLKINADRLDCYGPYLQLPVFKNKSSSPIPCAQTTRLECGTLGMMYLKELLKEEAKQMREFTLQIPCLSADNETLLFFLPSPQVLRYSQSSRFNKVIAAMLEDVDRVEVVQDRYKCEVSTVKYLLKTSLSIAQSKQDEKLAKQLESMLADLPDFRRKWLAVYHEITAKRETMTKEATNHYLCYTTRRMEEIKNELVVETRSLGI